VYPCQNILSINTDYYPKQQQPVGFINVDAMCSEDDNGCLHQCYVHGIRASED